MNNSPIVDDLSSSSLEGLRVPLYERVRLAIQRHLVAHDWSAGVPIPTEQELAREYDVSVGTVRKAVECLVKDGLLVKKQGRGTFIKRPDFSQSLLRFFRYRGATDAPVVPTGIVRSVETYAAIKSINEALHLDADAPLLKLNRVRLVDNTVVLSEEIWLSEERFAALKAIPAKHFDNLLYPFYDEKCGQFVFSADETLSFESQLTNSMLHAEPGELLVKIVRIAYDVKRNPIEYRITYGRPENFQYQVKIR